MSKIHSRDIKHKKNSKKSIFFETRCKQAATNRQKNKKVKRDNKMIKVDKKMKTNCYLKPAWTHNGSIRTDLPLTVITKTSKRRLMEIVSPGQLCCVGKVYLKTHNGLVRIK